MFTENHHRSVWPQGFTAVSSTAGPPEFGKGRIGLAIKAFDRSARISDTGGHTNEE
jgi:hypothetical protein